jgi:sugar-phosphatase
MRFAVDALLFDMDGTLVDSTPSVLRSWRTVVAEFAVPPALFAAVPTHGRPSVEILADLMDDPELIARAAARLDELELADTADIRVLPGAAELTAAVPAGRWAVVTSAGRPLAEVRLAAAGIAPPQLVTIDDVARGKPDPEPFLLAAKLLGVDPERCLVLEDAPAGIASGRAAGARTVAVVTTHTADELDADLVVPDLSALRLGRDGDRLVVEPVG